MVSEVTGLNLHVYPSQMLNESRLFRIAGSISTLGAFASTHLVGVAGTGLRDREVIGEGVVVVRIRALDVLPGALGKMVRALTWQVAVFRAYWRLSVGVVNAHSVWMLPLCWLLSRFTGAALFYNPHELETRTPTMRGLKRIAAQIIERVLIGRAQVVTVVNASIARWYGAQYGIPLPVAVRNIPVTDDKPAGLRDALGVDADEMLFIHTGRLTAGRSIEAVLDAFEVVEGPHIVFLGDGPLGHLVRERAARCEFIHWLAPVPPERVVSYVREADVALCLIDTRSLSYEYSSPNKLFEALVARTPPLCSDLIEARVLLAGQADRWILTDVNRQLAARISRLTASDVAGFRRTWSGLPSWDDEVAALLALYERTAEAAE